METETAGRGVEGPGGRRKGLISLSRVPAGCVASAFIFVVVVKAKWLHGAAHGFPGGPVIVVVIVISPIDQNIVVFFKFIRASLAFRDYHF